MGPPVRRRGRRRPPRPAQPAAHHPAPEPGTDAGRSLPAATGAQAGPCPDRPDSRDARLDRPPRPDPPPSEPAGVPVPDHRTGHPPLRTRPAWRAGPHRRQEARPDPRRRRPRDPPRREGRHLHGVPPTRRRVLPRPRHHPHRTRPHRQRLGLPSRPAPGTSNSSRSPPKRSRTCTSKTAAAAPGAWRRSASRTSSSWSSSCRRHREPREPWTGKSRARSRGFVHLKERFSSTFTSWQIDS